MHCLVVQLLEASVTAGLKALFSRAFRRPEFVALEEQAYRRMAAKSFKPDAIVDVGAYEGNWTRLARRVFEDVPALMIEPQFAKKPFLEKACSELPQVRYVSALLSGAAGEIVTFYEMETGSSFLPEQSNAERREVQLSTAVLDQVAAALPGQELFLKIDVQGAELQVLEGGAKTLNRARVVQLEIALLSYNEGAPSMVEVLSYMEARGLHPFDIAGLTRLRGHLVQIDLLFARDCDMALRPKFIKF